MRHAVHLPSPPIALEVTLARGAREIVRAAVGFALFLLLLAPARWIGLDRLYAKLVLGVAQPIVLSTQHFPVLENFDTLTLRNLEFGVILTLALFLVSTKLGLVSRLKRFGLLLAALFSFHVLVAIVTIKVSVAQDLLNRVQLLVLSPEEFRVLDRIKYFCYDLGLEISSFVILLLAVVWNLTASRARSSDRESHTGGRSAMKRHRVQERDRGSRRRLLVAVTGLGVIAIVVCAALVYARVRESNPGHVQAHAKLGHLFWKAHKDTKAAEQYRCALAGGTTDPEVFYNLSRLEARVGNRGEARRLLDQGLGMAHEPVWQTRFHEAIGLMQSKSASP